MPSARDSEETVPPLFAGLLGDEGVRHDFDSLLHSLKDHLAEDRFVDFLGKFREAVGLSRLNTSLETDLRDAAISNARKLCPQNWRVAEALLFEAAPLESAPIWSEIERAKGNEAIQLALDEEVVAQETEYLPHVRERLASLVVRFAENAGLADRLEIIDERLALQVIGQREKNFARLKVFRDSLDNIDSPHMLRRFPTLVAPFVDPYRHDPAFAGIVENARTTLTSYEHAAALLAGDWTRECLNICRHALKERPHCVLFQMLEAKAMVRDQALRLELSDTPALAPAAQELAVTPEPIELPQPAFAPRARVALPSLGIRIAITEEAWSHLKTGLAATVAVLLMVLVLASSYKR